MTDTVNNTQPGSSNTILPHKSSNKIRTIVMIVILVIAIVVAIFWWLNYRKYISTDDANLDSYRIDVASQVDGRITKLYVMEGDTVKEGDVMFELDNTLIISKLQAAQAQYEQLLSEVVSTKTSLIEARKNYEIAVLAENLSKKNFERAKEQFNKDVIPLETYQTFEENWKTTVLQTQIAQNRIESTQARIAATEMSALAAKANIESMSTDLSYYMISAPASGIIGKRWVLEGDVISAGQNVFTLNMNMNLWVAVYLEETKFNNIRIGQNAKFTLDAYDKLTFYGKIYYIGDNAASEFALVPPNNASGNFTKVTQRIPLKISIDNVEGDEKQKDIMRLVSGMSATVKIIKE